MIPVYVEVEKNIKNVALPTLERLPDKMLNPSVA